MADLTAVQLAEAESLVREIAQLPRTNRQLSDNISEDATYADNVLDGLILRARSVVRECAECSAIGRTTCILSEVTTQP
jgi:hypothetical protein